LLPSIVKDLARIWITEDRKEPRELEVEVVE
jgi:hypothetical protein